MQSIMQNFPYLMHFSVERRPIDTVPSPENTCPFPGSFCFWLQFQVGETLKNFKISQSRTAIERNASPKNETNLEENY